MLFYGKRELSWGPEMILSHLLRSDEPGQHKHITYGELLRQVCAAANTLTNLGVKKGDVSSLVLHCHVS